MARRAARFLISGMVQGVGFRHWTSRTALRLGLDGWVRNLYDGRVEVWAEGESEQLDELASWCERGPPSAEVTSVEREEREPEDIRGFAARRDGARPV